MATVLDLSLLTFFRPIIVVVLVAAMGYGIFNTTKLFGDNKGLQAVIALLIALIVGMIPALHNLLATMLPWFVVFFIFVVFVLMGYKLFGVNDGDISKLLHENSAVTYWVIAITVIILLGSIGAVFFAPTDATKQTATNTSVVQPGSVGATGEGAFWATIIHPKVLGMVLMLLIGVFTILTLTGSGKHQ